MAVVWVIAAAWLALNAGLAVAAICWHAGRAYAARGRALRRPSTATLH